MFAGGQRGGVIIRVPPAGGPRNHNGPPGDQNHPGGGTAMIRRQRAPVPADYKFKIESAYDTEEEA